MIKEPLVSIIILNYNGLNDFKDCFESIYNSNYTNIELILIDNNSKDNSVRIIREKYNNVKIIELKKNYGFAEGNNIGIIKAKGEYVVLLNLDTIVDKNWLSELVKVAQLSKKIGIVGSKIYYDDDKTTINFAGSSCDKYGNTRNIGDKKFDYELVSQQNLKKSFYICGASILIKPDLYKKMKLFDPDYFMYYEDVDFCWRAWIFGYEVFYTNKSFIYHKIDRIAKDFKKKKYLSERNKLRTLLKNYELKSLLKVLPNYVYIRLQAIYQYRKDKQGLSRKLLVIYLKSLFWNLIHIRSLISYRCFIQYHRSKNDKFIFKLMEELTELEKKSLIKNKSKDNIHYSIS